MGKAEGIMNDPMFVETLIISSSFFIIAIILIASVLLLANGQPFSKIGRAHV